MLLEPGNAVPAEPAGDLRRARSAARRFSIGGAAWHSGGVTDDLAEPAEWLALPDVAERLDLPITKLHQMIRDRVILAVRRDGVLRIPGEMVAGETVIKHLPGVLTVLFDAGYSDLEALALHAGRFPRGGPDHPDHRAQHRPRPRGQAAGTGARLLTPMPCGI